MTFGLLGPLEVRANGSLLPLTAAKQKAVLATLLLQSGETVSTDELIDALWPERPPDNALTTLQGYVLQLRRLLEPEAGQGDYRVLVTSPPGYVLAIEPEQIDVRRFERLFHEGSELLKAGSATEAGYTLHEALALWRGSALVDFQYASAFQSAIGRLEEERLACLEERLDADLALGREIDVVGELTSLAAQHPLRERLRGQLMVALYRSGRQADALEAYREFRQRLDSELGIEPTEELKELERRILRHDAELAREPVDRLPQGTVTLLATDLDSSTLLLRRLGDRYADVLGRHRRILAHAFASHAGHEVDSQGDSVLAVFTRAKDAVTAAAEAQRALAEEEWPEDTDISVRMGIHTGEPSLVDGKYIGLDVHRVSRICAAAHGGQTVLSEEACRLVDRIPESLELVDLGLHRLKDLAEPERLYQLGKQRFPPLRSLHETKLPIPPTPFLGRKQELEGVVERLSGDEVRLLTLTGAGGTGKTRLALQAAMDVAVLFPDGVFWVGLASLRDPRLVLPTIAQALDTTEELAAHIGSGRMLLVLDNFEHVLEAAVDLAGLLSTCPELRSLVTSRERLRVAAEWEYPVQPLQEQDAVDLFRARARATGADAEANGEVLDICRRVDNLPLAIELAAARVRALSPAALLQRLDRRLPLLTEGPRDLPARQQTLRSTISWSFDLLNDAEQALFRNLAVFAGGCTCDAAVHVCDGQVEALESLVEKSLVTQRDDRYRMLETIREYALEGFDDTRVRQRHAEYFLEFAEQAEDAWFGPEHPSWIARVDAERDNIRAVLAHLEATDQTEEVLSLVGNIRYYWATLGAWSEGRRWVEPALERTAGQKSRARAKALGAAGMFANPLGDLAAAKAYAEESLALFREFGRPVEIGRSLGGLGAKMAGLGDVRRARELFEEATIHLRAGDDKDSLALVVGNLGDLALREREYDRAEALFEVARSLHRELAREDSEPVDLYNLALLRFYTDRDLEAARAARDSLAASQRIGDPRFAILNVFLLASLASRQGDAEGAARLFGAAEAERVRLGLAFDGSLEGDLHDATLEDMRESLGVEAFEAAFEEGRSTAFVDAVVVAEAAERAPSH